MKKEKPLIAENIRKLRVEAGWTQKQLGDMTGLSSKHVSQIETGSASIGKTVIEKMCAAFAVDEMTLRFGERKPDEKTPQIPEHLKRLFEEIKNVFPDSASLVEKSDTLSKVMRDLRGNGE